MDLMRTVVEDLLGWTLDATKRVADCPQAEILGVEVAWLHGQQVRAAHASCDDIPTPTLEPRVCPGNTVQGRDQGSEVDGGNPPGSLLFPNMRAPGGASRAARDAQVLASGRLTPACASKLAGRLQWGSSQVFGRAARVWMPALYAHSHGCVPRGFMPRPLQSCPRPAQEDVAGGRAPETVPRMVE